MLFMRFFLGFRLFYRLLLLQNKSLQHYHLFYLYFIYLRLFQIQV